MLTKIFIFLASCLVLTSCKKGSMHDILDTENGKVWRLVKYEFKGDDQFDEVISDMTFEYREGKGQFLTCDVSSDYDQETMGLLNLVPGNQTVNPENQLTIESWFISTPTNQKRRSINPYQGTSFFTLTNGNDETMTFELEISYYPKQYHGKDYPELELSSYQLPGKMYFEMQDL